MTHPDWEGRSILIVEDSATSRTLLESMLKGLPSRIVSVATAESLHAELKNHSFDLVLLDNILPDGTGTDLIAGLRERCPQTAVVIITDKEGMLTATEALARGADGYLEKRHLGEGPEVFQRVLERALLHRQSSFAQEQLVALKREIYGVVAHDLRSPAASASMALKIYQDRRSEDALGAAANALDRLLHRLDRYLDFSRVESGVTDMQRQCADLRDLVDEVVQQLFPLAQAKNQELKCEFGGQAILCDIDWGWMSQAVENLIENAIKYTPEGGLIEISTSQDKRFCRLEVSDEGPGIVPAHQGRIFRRFYRDPTSRESVRGTGLGLMIAKKVVEAHQGEISVESEGVAGRGSRFRIALSVIAEPAI